MNEKKHVGRPTNEEVRIRRNKKLLKVLPIIIVITFLIGSISYFTYIKSEKLNATVTSYDDKVHFIALNGAAGSILIESNGEYGLIDAGYDNINTYTNSKCNMIYKYLQSKHVKRLKFIIATHNHEDHIGCINSNLYNLKVDGKKIKINKIITKNYVAKDSQTLTADMKDKAQKRYNNMVNKDILSKNKISLQIIDDKNITINHGDFTLRLLNHTQRINDKTRSVGQRYNEISENVNSIAILMYYNKGNNRMWTYFASDLENANYASNGKFTYLKTPAGTPKLYAESATAKIALNYIICKTEGYSSCKDSEIEKKYDINNNKYKLDLYYAAHHGYNSSNHLSAIGQNVNDLQFKNVVVGNTRKVLCKKYERSNIFSTHNSYNHELGAIARINANLYRNNTSGTIYFSCNAKDGALIATYTASGIKYSNVNDKLNASKKLYESSNSYANAYDMLCN